MKILVNGEPYQHLGSGTIRSLLDEMHAESGRVAVMVNDEVIRRDGWDRPILKEADRVEVMVLVGGG